MEGIALAKTRTILANRRTLLAYCRTGLAFIIGGLAILHYFDQFHTIYIYLGGGCALTGIITLGIGIHQYRTMSQYIDGGREPDPENPEGNPGEPKG
jgi:putative membrane protein